MHFTNILWSLLSPSSLSPLSATSTQYEGPDGKIVFRIDDGPPFHVVEDVLNHYKVVADRLPCKLTEYCPRPPTRMTEC